MESSRRTFLAATGAGVLGVTASADKATPNDVKGASDMQPNVLVIMVDQLQAQRMRMYGGVDLNTPNLDQLASEGVLFKEAFTTCPLCTPARQSFWTGQYPHACKSVFNGAVLPEDVPLLPKMLKQRGYHFALVGKNHALRPELFDEHWESGHGGAPGRKDDPNVREYERTAQLEFLRMCHGAIVDLPDDVTTTARTTARGLEFLEEDREQPFLLWLSYPEPHSPFVTTKRYADMYPPESLTLPESVNCDLEGKPSHFKELHQLMGADKLTEDDIRKLTQIYYGMITQIDDGVGAVMSKLKEKGLDENTIVVFLSDHGEYMGNLGGTMQKSAHLYDALMRIPLMIRWPGHLPEGMVVEEALVEQMDIMPTLCTLTGTPIPPGVQGVDLTGLMNGEPYERDAVFSEIGWLADPEVVKERMYAPDLPWQEARAFFHFVAGHYAHRARCIRTKTHKLTAYQYGERELYDMVKDPEETENLYGKRRMRDIQDDLTNRLLDWSIASENPLPDLTINGAKYGDLMRKQLRKGFERIPDAT